MRRSLAVLLLTSLPSLALAEPCAPRAGMPADSAASGRFHLQSRFWVNLHQRLLYASGFASTAPAGLTREEQETWDRAVARYQEFRGRSVPFQDPRLVAVQAALSGTSGDTLPALPEVVGDALRETAPLYRRQQWEADDRANRYWIAMALPQLAAVGDELLCEHERVYGTPMPRRVVIDVASHAWEHGAYTTGDAETARSVISSRDPGYAGFHATEMVFHEAAHGIVGTRDGAVGGDITAAARELSLVPPPNLWHAVQFLTSGELARRALAARGVADYRPVSDELFGRAWPTLEAPLKTHWIAVIDGRLTRAEALRNVLREVGRPRSSPSPPPR